MVEIRAHSPRELKSERKVCVWCVQVHFAEECFSRAFHMEGCCRRLIPGSIRTILKIEPGKQSSKRQHRKVSLVQFYLSFSIVSAMKFSFSWKYPICLFPDISAICKDIFKWLIKLVLFISPRCCNLVFYPFCLSQPCGALERCWFTEELFNGFQSFQINRKYYSIYKAKRLKNIKMFEPNVFGCLPYCKQPKTFGSNILIFFNLLDPDDGKQPKTFGSNILIFFNLLALYIEYFLLSEHYGQP